MCMYSTREVQKRASDPLVLELQAVLTCLTWVLGPEFNSQSSKSSFFTAEPFLQPSALCFL